MTTAYILAALVLAYLANSYRMRRIIAKAKRQERCRNCPRLPQGCLGRFGDRCMGEGE